MRQAGVLAAAVQHALDHQVQRLAHDHVHAAQLAQGLQGLPGMAVSAPQTNIVFLDMAASAAAVLQARLAAAGVMTGAVSGVAAPGFARLRLVTHLDISAADIKTVLAAFAAASSEQSFARSPASTELGLDAARSAALKTR